MNNTHYYIIPGLGNSGPEHWQTFFEGSDNNFKRINQLEWDAPQCGDWIKTIDKEISNSDLSAIVLVGHSLGCAAIAHWATRFNKQIKGALLVAPSDLEAPQYTFPAKGFNPIPITKFNFRTIVVASEDDPWVSLERAKYFAGKWGSEFVSIGKAGHINAASGYGKWTQGLDILKTLSE